ncbi:hypothetical protein N658DRAFT_67716 [Parathielavia hyrcaniae]|uniref:Uncharacterized protein n=1 Tax=Parathielavia hyrcaniae TaxID=113614 RepID=A0AAN6Q573_9PEZI|nr:hypothetical protein N658DRAFT_55407 [Parathielavia hyrcaniae]KAK4101191.1 hypothetical protein N658DRAFT_67716 [Parathielavia hyrcaniae]
MCQLIRRRFHCDHNSGEPSYWHPPEPTECAAAVAAGVYDMNGQLQRCTGDNYTTATFQDHGYCPNNSHCRKKAFKKGGWTCHACNSAVPPGGNTCGNCNHKSCYECWLN